MFKNDKLRHSKQKQQQQQSNKDASSASNVGGSGSSFVVKKSAHLRSAVAKKEAESSSNTERLSSPLRITPSQNALVSNSFGHQIPTLANETQSHTLVVVFPTLEEFVCEREVLRPVLADLQQYFCELDLDLECCTLFAVGNILHCIDQYLLLTELLAKPNTSALVFIGDCYGEELLPLELTSEEFNAIKESALELADDAAFLLEQFYKINRSKEPAEYQLMANKDPEGERRLRSGINKCVKRMYDDGMVLQLAGQERRKFTKSFIELCAEATVLNTQSLLITRRFKNAPKIGMDRWMDPLESNASERLNLCKNALSSKLITDRHLPYIIDLNNKDFITWNHSKEAQTYQKELAAQLMEKIKEAVIRIHPNCLSEQQQLHLSRHSFTIYDQSGSTTALQIARVEEEIHKLHLISRISEKWAFRGEKIDAQLKQLVLKIFDKERMKTSDTGLYVHIYGPSGCGKTSILCRLYQLILQNVREMKTTHTEENNANDEPVLLVRFVHLTDGTMFAHEMFRNAFLTACDALNNNEAMNAFLKLFELGSIFKNVKSLFEKQNVVKPICFLIDDANLLKFGRLDRIEHNLRKIPRFISLICTSNSAQLIPGFPLPSELIEAKAPTVDQAITILCEEADNKPTLSSHQLGLLRQALVQQGDLNMILGSIQRDEILTGQNTDISSSIDNRLIKAEIRCGRDNVRLICEFLCCSPYGLTALELLDAFRLRNYATGFTFEPQDVLSATPLLVLRQLNPILDSIFMDQRRVYFFRSVQIASTAQHRYLQSAGDIKLANETLAKIFGCAVDDVNNSNEESTVAMVYPRPIFKEGGLGVDIRRLRYHWYYLLRMGDIDALKRTTLCSFPYLEATFRTLGLTRLLSIFEECLQQILDNDLLCIFEQVLLPGTQTFVREPKQFVSEFLNRLRYTRAKNSEHLNRIVEQAMQWTDSFDSAPLLVPLTCWIPPPKMNQVLSFAMPQWKTSKLTIIQPTYNHQHLLVAGNELAPNCIYMLHIASQLLIRIFTTPGHSHVTSLCASKCKDDSIGTGIANHHFFTSSTANGTIQIWNFAQAEYLKTLQVCQARIICSTLSSDDSWIAVGSTDSCARIVSLDSGHTNKIFRDHTGPVVGVQLSSDDNFLVTGSGDFAVMVWDIEREVIMVRLQGLMAPVTCIALTSNDAFLAVACEDETLRVFSLVSAQELHELIGHEARINALQASADDCKLFAGTKGKVLVYDIHNGQLLEVLPFALDRLPITSIRISDDDSFIMAAAGDRINIWAMNSIDRDVAATQQKEQLRRQKQQLQQSDVGTADTEQQIATSVSCIQIAPDEKGAGCGTLDGIVAYWDLDVCQCMWTSNQQKTGSVTAMAFSIDAFLLISGSHQGSVSLWEVSSGQLFKQVQLHSEAVTSLSIFFDGMRVLSSDSADNAYLWSLASLDDGTGNKKVELIASIANMHPPVFVKQSDTIIIAQHATNPREMNIWTLSGDRLFTRSKVHHNEPIVCYAVNRSGTVLITAAKDLSLKLWQMDTGGLLIQILVGHEQLPTCCCVSEDAQIAISASKDSQMIIWEIQTGSILRSVKRTSVIEFLEISLDGSVFCSTSNDGWVEAWHTKSGQLLSACNTHRQIEQLIMGADGDRILIKLAGTAQLAIICLHNTPAHLSSTSASRYERIVSDTSNSLTSNKYYHAPVLIVDNTSPSGSEDGPKPLGDRVIRQQNNGIDEPELETSRVDDQQRQQIYHNNFQLERKTKGNENNALMNQKSSNGGQLIADDTPANEVQKKHPAENVSSQQQQQTNEMEKHGITAKTTMDTANVTSNDKNQQKREQRMRRSKLCTLL